jgi:hypothetical protein
MSDINEVEDSSLEIDTLVKTYLTIRSEREKIGNEYQLRDAELKAEQVQLEQALLEKCNTIHADSIRTSQGTVIKTLRENYVCSDWDSLKAFIVENNMIEFLQQRLHNSNIREYMANHGEDGLPPGMSSMREYSITVKKPVNKY